MSFADSAAMITAILGEHEGQYVNIGGADVTRRRAKILGNIRRAVSKMWYYREWPWAYDDGTITLATDLDIQMPSNFRSFGRDGGIWINTTNGSRPINWVPPHRYNDLISGRPASGEPRVYTLHTQTIPLPVAGANQVIVLLYPTT